MEKEIIKLKYDGPILDGHSMDVNHLAPALLSLADLFQITNKKFNDDSAAIKVLVNADLKQNCFELNVELVQSLFERAKLFIGDSDVASTKEMLEWIGIVLSITVPGTLGLFKALSWLGKRTISNKEIEIINGNTVVKITIESNNNNLESIRVFPETAKLMEDQNAIKSAQMVVMPLTHKGYESLEFSDSKHNQNIISIDDAVNILSVNKPSELIEDEFKQTITTWISVYSPVLDPHAEKWRFMLNGNVEYMDISQTEIALMAIKRGSVGVGDLYKVELEISQSITSTGKITYSYKITKLLDFKPSSPRFPKSLFE